MGNSKLSSGCQFSAGESTRHATIGSQNGILGKVPGDLIAGALRTLPDPSKPGPEHHEVIIDARGLGRVRLSVERKLARHRRHSHYYWAAWYAEHVSQE